MRTVFTSIWFYAACLGFTTCSVGLGEVLEALRKHRFANYYAQNTVEFWIIVALNLVALVCLSIRARAVFQRLADVEYTDHRAEVRWSPLGMTVSLTDFVRCSCYAVSYAGGMLLWILF